MDKALRELLEKEIRQTLNPETCMAVDSVR
jgi:hypothetical protein